MIRGEQEQTVTLPAGSTVVVPSKRKWVVGNIIDPNDGTIHYHVVSTKTINVIIVVLMTLMLCGIIVLGMVIYLKVNVDQNKQSLDELRKEGQQVTP